MLKTAAKDFRKNRTIYLLALPVIAYYLVFHYGPMYGVQIAFKDFSPSLGIADSPWVGFRHFSDFFHGFYFWRIVRNTLLLSLYSIAFSFPASIVLALLLNELRNRLFKRTVQSITYLPHFISLVVVVGMMVDFLSADGLVNQIIAAFGLEPFLFLQEPKWFRFLYVSSGIWQEVGWGSIIYLAAISGIDPTLYEAAKVDGAGRFKRVLHITIPGILPTVAILFILRMGSVMAVGDEKILLLYNPMTYETADVIGTYVYRKGILESSYSFSSAVGLFNAVINFAFLLATNLIIKRSGGAKLF
ncbi:MULTISPECIES: ABC transporter permease [Cohnella]|uniref:Putative aldouronate transport system permease protein n=1 Tax=Cohnella phaseoli TaxID=456490 RepID=A0A3D9JRP3_9BACL|nr:ABC transporter permease subunit [Cohnella phaseoli]RED76791.1 putative aldouronate transport system permease protein [Cohnella phaseoli]